MWIRSGHSTAPHLKGVIEMTRADFETKTFDELIEQLNEEHPDIHSYDYLKDFAKHLIDEENIGFALHILNAIYTETGEWFEYDCTMGTLQTPSGLTEKADLEHLIWE